MSIRLSIEQTAGTTKPMIPQGSQIARCVGVMDLGTVMSEWQGKTKPRKRVSLMFEFPKHKATFREEDGPQPLVKTLTYTKSLDERGNLRKDLESWRGEAFTQKELLGWDLDAVLGAPCMATITHKQTGDGNVKDRITGIGAMHEDIKVPDQVIEGFVYEIKQHPQNWDRLPPWAKDEVKQSDEYKALEGTDTSVNADADQEEETDAVPF
jgi:hypothetical protein